MQYVSESRWTVRTGNRTVQVSFPNCKAEAFSRPRRYRLLVSATVILLGLSDLMRCGIFIMNTTKKGGTARLISCPLKQFKEARDFLFYPIKEMMSMNESL